MRRRDFMKAVSAMSALILLPTHQVARNGPATALASDTQAFSPATVPELARSLAAEKFVSPKTNLPKEMQQLTYDQYRDIRFKPERALWLPEGLSFHVEFFHQGFIFNNPVEIYSVADGQAQRIVYSPDFFAFGPRVPAPPDGTQADFSGFRLRAPINRPDHFDEFVVFQGASYFRAVAKGQIYGLSARGLALNTAAQDGEEFPLFRTFWIEQPRPEASVIVVHALLDSESTTGAYRFTIRPGDATVMDVEMTLYPRVELQQVGLAPLTSMFRFGPNDRVGIDDFRPAVHDSDGLAIWNGKGEWLWRPLINPETLQVSAFVDDNPRGFGLLQRHRKFTDYQDLEAHYERRPSLWVETIGNWGNGNVQLVEIPSKFEFHDNVVAFWRPSQPIPAQGEYRLTYRLHWCWTPPAAPELATVTETRVGAGPGKGTRLFMIDFIGGPLADLKQEEPVEPVIALSAGIIKALVARPNTMSGGWRVSFILETGGAKLCDLRCTLKLGDKLLSEVWSYRWTL